MKIFSVNFNKSINDKYGATSTLGSTAIVRKDEKGLALKCQSLATDYISYGDISSINSIGTGEFSFVIGANTKGFLNHGSGFNTLGGKGTADGISGFRIWYLNNTSIISNINNTAITANINHQNKNNLYIITRNSSGICTFYVNGISQGTPVIVATTISTTAPMIIGSDQNANRTPNASIYLSEVYNHCLSETEIQKLTADFQAQFPVAKPKRGFVYPKPTDLSKAVNNMVGSQLVTNGNFDTDTGWTKEAGWTIDTVNKNAVATNATNDYTIYQPGYTIGKLYKVTYTINTISSGGIKANIGSSSIATTRTTIGTYSENVLATSANLTIRAVGTTTATIDNVSVQEVTGLIAAYNMIPEGNTLVDISGNGRNATLTKTTSTKDGVYFNGVNSYAEASSPEYSVQGSICTRVKFKNVTSSGYIFRANNTGVNGMDLVVVSGNITYYIKNASGISSPVSIDREYNIVITWLLNGSKFLYVDGVLIGSNAYTSEFSEYSTFALGANYASGTNANVEIIDFKMYNRVLSLQEAKDYHNSFAKQVVLNECFCDSSADNSAITPREWIAGTGTYKVQENVIKNTELVTNGTFDSATSWIAGSGITVSGGKVNITGVASQYIMQVIPIELGKRYLLKYEVTDYTSGSLAAFLPAGVQVTVGSTIGKYQKEITVTSLGDSRIYFGGTGFIGSIDNISVTEIPSLPTLQNGSRYLECVTAGTIAIPSNTAYGTWEFDWMKGADGNNFYVSFINDRRTPGYQQFNGYEFLVDSNESLRIRRCDLGGASPNLFTTNSSYIVNNVWYRTKITRNNEGVFTMYIKGGSFTPTAGANGWTLVSVAGGTGTNPITDNTYKSSNYLGTMSLSAGDRLANIVIKNGIIIN